MLMVLFGAGASFGSVDENRCKRPYAHYPLYRPPLAAELFSDRQPFNETMANYPNATPIIADLRVLAEGIKVEQELENYEKQAETLPSRNIELAAVRFYLRD